MLGAALHKVIFLIMVTLIHDGNLAQLLGNIQVDSTLRTGSGDMESF